MVLQDLDRHALGLLACEVKAIDPTAALEDNRLVAQRWELDVELAEARELTGLLLLEFIDVEVHPLQGVAIGEEVDPVAVPHRKDVLRVALGEVDGFPGLEIVEPDII